MTLKLIPVILLEIKIIAKPDFFYDASKTIPKWNIFSLDPEIKTSGIAHHWNFSPQALSLLAA